MNNAIPEPYFAVVFFVLAFSIGASVALRMRQGTFTSLFPILSAISAIALLLMFFSPISILVFGKSRTVVAKRTYITTCDHPLSTLLVGLLTTVSAQDYCYGGLIRGVPKAKLEYGLPEVKDYDEKTDVIVWFQGFVPREAHFLGSEAAIYGVDTNENLFVFCVFPREGFESIINLTADHLPKSEAK
jgi:hypothetical protein